MSDKIVLSAEPRNDVGKGASRRLRRGGVSVPAVIYGGDEPPRSISLIANELLKAEKIEAFYSQVLEIQLEGAKADVIVKDLQRHPARGEIMHADLQRVRADVAITVTLQFHFVGEEECVGVRLGGGQILHNLSEVAVQCLPGDLPEYLTIDMTDFEVGQSLHLSDLKLPEGVVIPELDLGEDHDQTVVSVAEKRGGDVEEAGDDDAAAPSEDAGEEG